MAATRLAIIGAGELGLQLLDLSQNATDEFDVVGFFDDTKETGTLISNIPVIGGLKDIESSFQNSYFDMIVIAIGYKHMMFRDSLFTQFYSKIPFATIIHKSCLINSSAKIKQGSVIYPGCIIDKNVTIGRNVLLNLGVTVAHDTSIGDNSFLAPRVAISGFVNVGKSCFAGTNSTIIDNLTIGNNVIIGAGAVLIDNVDNDLKVVGNPAKKI